jgi:hypothetical protein
MDEPPSLGLRSSPEFEMSSRTVAALRARGGNLYIWWDNGQAALLRAAAKPPRGGIEFETFSCPGALVHLDREIAPTGRWLVQWKRLPWPHFRVLFDPPEGTGGGWGAAIIEGIFDLSWFT